jgi:hypothetical protein
LSCSERRGRIFLTKAPGQRLFLQGYSAPIPTECLRRDGNTPPPRVWRLGTQGLNAIPGEGIVKYQKSVDPDKAAVHLAGRRRVAVPAGGNLFEMGDYSSPNTTAVKVYNWAPGAS